MSRPDIHFRVGRFALRLPSAAAASIVGFALALVALVWVSGYRHLSYSQELMREEAASKASNLALAFEHNVAIIAGELDRILLYMRQSRLRAGPMTSWQTLVKEQYTVAEQAVQIAIIDKTGQMITSTAMLYPQKPVDLSDREHFKFHAQSRQDVLYISKPMVGRASGKASVQFARGLTDESGDFAGVIVVSLDPDYVTRTYSKLNLGDSGGLALNGSDGIVRAGTGHFQAMIGNGFREGTPLFALATRHPDTRLDVQAFPDGRKIVATRQVSRYPLEVVVALDDVESTAAWTGAERSFLVWSAGLSGLIVVVAAGALTWQRRTESLLLHIARHDTLTGLANRLSFQGELKDALRDASEGNGFALHLVDLDGFKQVNDSFGHGTGDQLLCAVGERLVANRRCTDFIARLGGDEFAIIQRGVNKGEAAEVFAERMCNVLAKPFAIDGKDIRIAASIGVVRAPSDASTASELVNAADLALYCAKSKGGRGYRRYRDAMTVQVQEQRELERDLHQALKRGELQLHYQPIMCLMTQRPVGFEALLRWEHAVRGFVPPSMFIPIAEQSGLIDEIGAWALRRACKDAAKCPYPMSIAVNCSPVQFNRGALPAIIASALAEAGLPAERLEIEITESTLMQHTAETLEQLNQMCSMGVMLSLDDFGTGYSSLSYLQSYPFKCIKIDRSFVQAIDEKDSKMVIIRAIVQLASSLGMKTIAEGIETIDQLRLLRDIGCSEAQGYLFSRPVPISDALRFLARFDRPGDRSHDRGGVGPKLLQASA